jgi:hypothetical protein
MYYDQNPRIYTLSHDTFMARVIGTKPINDSNFLTIPLIDQEILLFQTASLLTIENITQPSYNVF